MPARPGDIDRESEKVTVDLQDQSASEEVIEGRDGVSLRDAVIRGEREHTGP